jgi:hypothetical protein
MANPCREEIVAGGQKGFIRRDEYLGGFPQNTQQIFIVSHRNLRMASEIILIIEIVIQKCHAHWQGQGYGQ